MENMVVPPKIKRITIWLSNSTSEYIPKRIQWGSQRHLYTCVHSIICNGQKVEASQYSSTDEWINKMYKHSEMLFSIKKGDSDLC